MEFGFVKTLTIVVHKCQRFSEGGESLCYLTCFPICLGEQRQPIVSPRLCSCGSVGRYGLNHLWYTICCLLLHSQRPAEENAGEHLTKAKSLLPRNGQCSFNVRSGFRHFRAQLVHQDRGTEGILQTRGGEISA